MNFSFLQAAVTGNADIQICGSIKSFFSETVDGIKHFFTEVWDSIVLNLIEKNRYEYILSGLWITVRIAFFAAIFGALIGILLAIVKVAAEDNKVFKPFAFLANIYTTVIRGTPALVQLFIVYYSFCSVFRIDRFYAAIISFSINSGAYVAEIVRAGIMSIDKGQIEAGRSLGLSQRTTMIKIVCPQALKNILPALGNEFISLLKETSVAGYIGIVDLSKAGDIIRSQTYSPNVPLYTVALVYLVIVVFLTKLLNKFERRLRKSDLR